MFYNVDPEKISLSGGKLIQVLDESVPEYVLEILDRGAEYMISSVPPDTVMDNSPEISYAYGRDSFYRRWNMQHPPNYTEWKISEFAKLEEYFTKWASNIFNFKCVISGPKTEVVWHSCHASPRVHIPLQIENTTFEILDKDWKSHSIEMHRGKMYMFNVCFPHRIKVFGNVMRKIAWFECDHLKIPHGEV